MPEPRLLFPSGEERETGSASLFICPRARRAAADESGGASGAAPRCTARRRVQKPCHLHYRSFQDLNPELNRLTMNNGGAL